MKKFIKATAFEKSTGTVTILRSDFAIFRVIAIINQTRGVLLYSTASLALKYTSFDPINQKVVVSVDTSTMDDADDIQVVYEASEDAAETMQYSNTQVVTDSSPVTFGAADYTKMQIFNNPTDSATSVRWTPAWETPSASNGAMIVPTSPGILIPAADIKVIAVNGTADVTVVYYR